MTQKGNKSTTSARKGVASKRATVKPSRAPSKNLEKRSGSASPKQRVAPVVSKSRDKTPAKTAPRKPTPVLPYKVRRIPATAVAIAVLRDLTQAYSDCCNFTDAIALLREGELYLAMVAISDKRDEVLRATCVTARQRWVFNQALNVVKKLHDTKYDPWPEVRALWFTTEHRCKRMNQKFRALWNRWARSGLELGEAFHPCGHQIMKFREALQYALRDDPDIDEITSEAHYGPGSTVTVRGQDISYVQKTSALDCSTGAVELAAKALAHDKVMWAKLGFDPIYASLNGSAYDGFLRVACEQLRANSVDADRLMFIFKSMTSRRSIGAQPTHSVFLQLGVHSVGLRILKRIGIDLTDQTWNQRLAREGSLCYRGPDPWCTLDKSNASNSVASSLPGLFFPKSWAKLLMALRTPSYDAPPEIGGGRHTYHMYAGMGNGTTFFVETLIFWAMTYATQELPIEQYVKRRPYAVYGDDVILRRSHAVSYIRFAEFMGFRFNSEKTFLEGPFRESCGGEYHHGIDVHNTALECEGQFLDLPEIVAFHNNLADHPTFKLESACKEIRALARKYLTPVLPTDPQGSRGFRPTGGVNAYDLVTHKGRVERSRFWQRPRTYIMVSRAKLREQKELDHWSEFAISLLRASQSRVDGSWSLPMRDAVNYRVVAETDIERSTVLQMLCNQLQRLRVHKEQSWFLDSQGLPSK